MHILDADGPLTLEEQIKSYSCNVTLNYRGELLNIYKQITNRVIERNIEESIRDITDPTKNSINEKCARIREAFVKQFDIIYAKHYFITGKRGEPKKIILPRELVEYQTTI